MARLQDKDMLIHSLMDEGMIAKVRLCVICSEKMTLTRCEHSGSDSWKWECRRQQNNKRQKVEVSIREGSWFEKSNMTLEKTMKLTYWWCQDQDQAQIKHELGLGESTGVD